MAAGHRVPPPVLLVAAGAVQRLVPRVGTQGPVRRTMAGTLAAASGVLLAASIVIFRRHSTTIDPRAPGEASTLVRSGPYRVSRNPMYLGDVGLLAAHAVFRGSWQGWVPVGVFAIVIDRFQILAEEEALREKFGDDFEDYSNRVQRWLGRRSVEMHHRR